MRSAACPSRPCAVQPAPSCCASCTGPYPAVGSWCPRCFIYLARASCKRCCSKLSFQEGRLSHAHKPCCLQVMTPRPQPLCWRCHLASPPAASLLPASLQVRQLACGCFSCSTAMRRQLQHCGLCQLAGTHAACHHVLQAITSTVCRCHCLDCTVQCLPDVVCTRQDLPAAMAPF